MKLRAYWVVCLAAIVGLGIMSRVVHTGWILIDKYLGDALYAAMVYVLLRIVSSATPKRVALASMAIMVIVEVFQLTMIPAHLLASDNLAARILARALGTEFAFRDLIAYAVGVFAVYRLDLACAPVPVRSGCQSSRFLE